MMKNLRMNTNKKRVIGFNVTEDQCIWMKAGIVNFHLCDNAFDCNTCPFDIGMRKAMHHTAKTGKDRDKKAGLPL